uniref:Nucleotidyltransferase domain-containing protein n=1 Tax=Candidatus Kentrum sp. DK TaxID=2126562 RepID=A0A450SFV4_9GAMM|nr:MAG: hypothetical protein BECKDK2373B_GA0170837_103431 [Candidatus Kentron sp. DK]
MRLTQRQKDTILSSVRRFLGPDADLRLFGSRVDDKKRGGDFDFYIETPIADADELLEKRLQLLKALHDTPAFAEEKIDLVIHSPLLGPKLPIAAVATREGIALS